MFLLKKVQKISKTGKTTQNNDETTHWQGNKRICFSIAIPIIQIAQTAVIWMPVPFNCVFIGRATHATKTWLLGAVFSTFFLLLLPLLG
jgi:hypothetical protein